jgi:hypothetical protein
LITSMFLELGSVIHFWKILFKELFIWHLFLEGRDKIEYLF